MSITAEEYTAVMNDREDIKKKLEAASGESLFLTTYYKRMLRACEVSYTQAVEANITFERKERNKAVKDNVTALKEKLKAEKK